MSKKEKIESITKVLSLKQLCEKADIKYHKVYFNFNGRFNSLTHQDKSQLVNTLHDELVPFLEKLGYHITVHRTKGQGQ